MFFAEVNKKRIGRVIIEPISTASERFDTSVSNDAEVIKSPYYAKRVARNFETWCNNKDRQDIEEFNIYELMRIYSTTTFLYRVPVNFDDVLNNILNYGTEKDYSSYYDKSIV